MALKTFVAGEVLTASDVNTYLVNTLFARKTSTESVTSSTTLQDDNDLAIAVAASSVYEFTSVLVYDGSTAGDLKFSYVGPAGATWKASVTRLQQGAASGDEVALVFIDDSAGTPVGATGASDTRTVLIHGIVDVSSTAGTFKLQWAQNASSGTATRLFANSFMCLRRVS